MARVRNISTGVRDAYLGFLLYQHGIFPTAGRAERIQRVRNGETVYVTAVDVWQALNGAGFDAEEYRRLADDAVMELDGDRLTLVDEGSGSGHAVVPNPYRKAIMTRWEGRER
jgi:hypothetical protein